MKILMLCDFYNENLEFQENILAKYYTKYGHDVIIITSTFESVFDYYSDVHDNSLPMRVYYDNGAKIIKLPYRFNILNRLRAYVSIEEILEREEPDLIYVHDIMLNILEAVKYKKQNPDCVMIMDYHADYSNSGKNWLSLKVLHGLIRKWYLDRSRKYLSKIFPVVPAGFKFLNEIYKVPYDEMELLPLGADVDLGREVLRSSNLNDLRKKYDITPGSRVIVTGGKLAPRKKTELLIEAFKKLNIPDMHLIIVGDAGRDEKEYKNKLTGISIHHPGIHFTGWLNNVEVYEHFAISDIAVFPASQSILWQQAISMGLPLIVGNQGEQSIQYLNLYNNIIILEAGEICLETIGEKIRELLVNPAMLASMREGAKKVTLECLDWNHLIDRTLRFTAKPAR